MSFTLGRRAWVLVLVGLATHCGVPAQDAEYPELKLRARSLRLDLEETRKEVLETITEVSKLYRNEQVTYPQPLAPGFEAGARERLDRLTGGSGLELVVVTQTERVDLTFRNDMDGDTVRYDVTLAFRITTTDGKLLQKGKGTSSHELPAKEATPEEMKRVLLVASLNAFDQYFALEDTLERLNGNIDAYLKAHPEAGK